MQDDLRGAFAPEEVGGETDEEQNDGDGEIFELARVAESEIDGIADNRGGDKDEEKRGPGIARDTVGNGLTSGGAANGEDGSGAKAVENPADKNYAADQFGEFSSTSQHSRPCAKGHDGEGGSAEVYMDESKLLEKEVVLRHGVEDARGGQDYAVCGAERGDKNCERDNLAGPGTEDGPNGGGGNGFAGGGSGRTESHEVGENSNHVKRSEKKGAGKKCSGEIPLRIDHLTGAVSSELPAFVSPENGNHRQTEIGEKTEPLLRCAQSGRKVTAMMAERKKYGAEEYDDADLHEGGPILQIGALARAPDIDDGDDSDHGYGHKRGGQWRERDDFRQVAAEGASQRGNRAAGDYQKETPAIEEGGKTAESVSDEAVEAAGLGIACGKLRISERAEKREDTADEPDKERKANRAIELTEDKSGSKKDAGADDGADEEK